MHAQTRSSFKAIPPLSQSSPSHHPTPLDPSNCMLVGLRPRLKTRPSLLDLIARHHIDSPQLPRDTSVDDEQPGPAIPHHLASSDNLHTKPRAASSPAATASIPSIRTMAPSRKEQEADEDLYGAVFSVSGPVIVAENMIGCAMYELVGCTHLRVPLR
jgi:hypothetical protein